MLNLEPAQPSTSLTAQRSRSTRVQIAGCFVVFLLVLVYAYNGTLQQYSRNPTDENLLIAVIMSFTFLGWLYWLTKLLVPKVEFFKDHLVARSLWGFSHKRSYPEISTLEVKHDHLYIAFKDGGKIALHKSEIELERLARWLAERDVSAVRDLKWEPVETSEDWGRGTVEPAILQNKAAPRLVLTTEGTRSDRIRQAAFWGAMLLLNVIGAFRIIQAHLMDPSEGLLFFVVFLTLGNALWIFMLVLSLVPKKEFYEDHILMRSISGRTRRRSYQEITNVKVDQDYFCITFNDGELIALERESHDSTFARWLAERGVTAARDLKVEPRLEESLAEESKILRLK